MGATPIGLLFGFKRVDAYATQKDLFKVRLQCPLAKKNQIISRIQPSKSRDAGQGQTVVASLAWISKFMKKILTGNYFKGLTINYI